jgi:hypothetical protein
METPRVKMIESMCSKGMSCRPRNKALPIPAVKEHIQAIAERGTTTRPIPAMPSPEAMEARMTCCPGEIEVKT